MKFSEYITESNAALTEKRTPSERLDKEYSKQVKKKGNLLLKVLDYVGYKDPKLRKEAMKAAGITQRMLDDEEWPWGGRTYWSDF